MLAPIRSIPVTSAVAKVSHIKPLRSLVQDKQASPPQSTFAELGRKKPDDALTYNAAGLLQPSSSDHGYSPGLTLAQQRALASSFGLTDQSTSTDVSRAIDALINPADESQVLVDILVGDVNIAQLESAISFGANPATDRNNSTPPAAADSGTGNPATIYERVESDTRAPAQEAVAEYAPTNYTSLSDADLLARLIGTNESRRLYRGSLRPLFSDPQGNGGANEKLVVAKELVKRSLKEELQQGALLNSPNAVRDYLKLQLSGYEHERFVAIFLDTQYRVIATEEMFRGSLSQTFVHPREVVKEALKHNAASVIFAHNHPSGVAMPSKADRSLTGALKQALALVDVQVLDHFIVTSGNKIYSMTENAAK